MALTQQTFLGASIRGFNASMGWGSQASTCTVELVEDATNGDSFSPPKVGAAVHFDYDEWHFGGLLQSYNRLYGQQGNPVYNVQIQDPRELLAGIQLILNDYTGSTGSIPNLYNIYGHLESLYGFGGSQVNDAGIPWRLVRDAFWNLQLWKPIYFRGAYFRFDPFIGWDLLPSYYRIPGDSISALDYVQNICEALACDFAIEMYPYTNSETPAANLIKVRLIRRNIIPANNAINRFVRETEGAVAKSAGYELSNEITTRFVVGGKVNNMYFQNRVTYNNTTQYDDTVAPYWGYDAYDRLVIGAGNFNGSTGKEYQFTLDGRPIAVQTGKTALVFYRTDLAEMHAARAGQDSWEAFLAFHNSIPNSIHFGKADLIGITNGKMNQELITLLSDAKSDGASALPKRSGIEFLETGNNTLRSQYVMQEGQRKIVGKVYGYIRKFATEYYGRKFMVRIPFVAGAWVPETNIIRLSLTPTQTGYVPEESWGVAVYQGYMPFNPEKFTDQQNKLYPYAGFAAIKPIGNSYYAFDKLSPDSFILDQYPNQSLGKMRENLYVKATVDENLVFVNKRTLFSPRAVVTLDGPIADNEDNTELESTLMITELKNWLLEEPTVLSSGEVEQWASDFSVLAGADWNWKPKEANFQLPAMCAVPLESQVLRYGPWYISNTAGKVEFENDSTLVPWNFGNFTAMNQAGWAKVTSALVSQQSHEQGQVEFPGVPTINLGRALIGGGPFVTDVNVQVTEAGVTTTYRMNTWNWQFGRLGKYNVERFARLSKVAQEQRKAFRQFYGYAQPLTLTGLQDERETPKDQPSTIAFAGEVVVEGSGDDIAVRTSVAAQTHKTMLKSVGDDDKYAGKAGISTDGIFVPYTTKTDDSTYLPKFEAPSAGATTPTSTDLNPFGGGSVGMVFKIAASGLPDKLTGDDSTEVKAVGLRAPIVVGGWGYNTNGSPVPSGTSGQFLTNYKQRADKWKVGPLDIRWDEERKVWATGGSSVGGQKIGILNGNLFPSGSAYVQIWEFDSNTGYPIETSDTQLSYDWLLKHNTILYSGTKVVIEKIGGVWFVTSAGCQC